MTKILIDEEVVKQALDFIEMEGWTEEHDATLLALRSALDAAEKVEPLDLCQIYREIKGIDAAPTPPTNTDELREAARAVVEHLNAPMWHGDAVIDRLRKALK